MGHCFFFFYIYIIKEQIILIRCDKINLSFWNAKIIGGCQNYSIYKMEAEMKQEAVSIVFLLDSYLNYVLPRLQALSNKINMTTL